jgi:hypothetical protein
MTTIVRLLLADLGASDVRITPADVACVLVLVAAVWLLLAVAA